MAVVTFMLSKHTARLAAVLVSITAPAGLLAQPLARQAESVATPVARSFVDPTYAAQANVAIRQLESYLESTSFPALSVAVARAGKIVWAEAVGLANLEEKREANLETRFRIGSTSKALTATLAGLLVDAKVLDLDRTIHDYLPDYPAQPWPITSRQLAGHLAGIRHYGPDEFMSQVSYPSVTAALAIFQDDPLLFEPGTAYSYTTYGYTLLSAVLEAAAKQDFLTLVTQRLFSPLAMNLTLPERSDDNQTNRASYYGPSMFSVRAPVQHVDNSNKWAGGGFESTPSDLATFGMALLGDQLVSPATRALLFTPQRLADGTKTDKFYGMGFRRTTEKLPSSQREVIVVHHGGTALGGRSFLVLIPEEELVISLLGNWHSSLAPFGDFATMALTLGEKFSPPGGTANNNQAAQARIHLSTSGDARESHRRPVHP